MTTAKPIENLTVQVANIASMEDRLSAMLTDKLNSSVAEMSAIQAHNTNQSNGPYQRQRYQQRPKTNFQQQNYQSPPISTCQGCGRYCLNRQSCPAQNSICRFCKVKGHFEQVCRKAKRKSMEISDKCAKICSLETNSGLARCIKSCALPVNSEIVLPVHVSRRIQGEQVLLEPNPNLEKKQLMGARCIVTVNKGKSVFRIINPTNKTVHLPRRYVLANAINVDEQFMQTLDNAKAKSINTIETKPKNTNRDNLEFVLSKAELTSQQKSQLRTFLNENKNVFATNLKELDQATSFKHKIETHDSHPVKMPFYRQPPHLQREIDRQVQEMLDNNIIVPSTSDLLSPVLLVRKRDGSYRFAIDYRKVKKQTKSVCFPLPRLECVFDAIGAANHVFST
ncbi:unnamed protein product [Mytilus coruscus]|uniref:Reverse transcriptase domain-containing protein n=1 Tax=Mytilus coruscus TaxID=42192 RepID=A0A6J8A9L9_MYTCO|nr:unnamed protein product [Mytilus coruscus]